jgi:hypothetical protein
MKKLKLPVTTIIILCIGVTSFNSSFIPKVELNKRISNNYEGQSCIGMKVNDKWLADPFDPKAIAKVDVHEKGKLTITDAPNMGKGPFNSVAFKIFVRKENEFKPEPVLEYYDKDITEVDLETVLKHCKAGDEIVLVTKDSGKYDPDFQKILVVEGEGC